MGHPVLRDGVTLIADEITELEKREPREPIQRRMERKQNLLRNKRVIQNLNEKKGSFVSNPQTTCIAESTVVYKSIKIILLFIHLFRKLGKFVDLTIMLFKTIVVTIVKTPTQPQLNFT